METIGIIDPYIRNLKRESEVYPTRLHKADISKTFRDSASILANYNGLDNNSEDIIISKIRFTAQLIFDASGYLFQNERSRSSRFIWVYEKAFPEIDIKEIRYLDKLAPLFAEKTRSLAEKLSNPERLTEEERIEISSKLRIISDSIESLRCDNFGYLNYENRKNGPFKRY
jgi:hypothetical protein